MTMQKGTNVPVAAASVRIELGRRSGAGPVDVDASALLLTAPARSAPTTTSSSTTSPGTPREP
jgi:hypothetical protein